MHIAAGKNDGNGKTTEERNANHERADARDGTNEAASNKCEKSQSDQVPKTCSHWRGDVVCNKDEWLND